MSKLVLCQYADVSAFTSDDDLYKFTLLPFTYSPYTGLMIDDYYAHRFRMISYLKKVKQENNSKDLVIRTKKR